MLRFVSAIALGGVLLVTLPAHADPVLIMGGRLSFDIGDPPSFRLELSEPPFRLSGVIYNADSENGSLFSLPSSSAIRCLFAPACFSGDLVSLGFTMSGTGLGRVGPAPDPENPPASTAAAAMFAFTTPEMPLVGQPMNGFSLEVPFQFRGQFRVFSDDSLTDVLYESALIGGGTATATFEPAGSPNSTGPYFSDDFVYVFAPVPEPATLTLVGIGLVSAGLARRRQRRNGPCTFPSKAADGRRTLSPRQPHGG